MRALSVHSFPQAILHVDGDAFFASCAQALNPKLKNRPVATGRDRGIATSVSYEARARGVKRGMDFRQIKRTCPECVFVSSDYESYSLFSLKMFAVVKRYTPEVEEYSIDECFADLTGLRRPLRLGYRQIIEKIKNDLEKETGLSFSLGLGPTKVIAKIASSWQKPSGLTLIPGSEIHLYLEKLSLEKIWGIGFQTAAYLEKLGLKTALDFAVQDEGWIKQKLTKPHWEIWQELRGIRVYRIEEQGKNARKTIVRSETFSPPSGEKRLVFSQLSKNVQKACDKARRCHLLPTRIFFFLKTRSFQYHGAEIKLNCPNFIPGEILKLIRPCFEKIFSPCFQYRATGVVFKGLREDGFLQMDLFGQAERLEKMGSLYSGIDRLVQKHGRGIVSLGADLDKTRHLPKTGVKKIGLPLLGRVG